MLSTWRRRVSCGCFVVVTGFTKAARKETSSYLSQRIRTPRCADSRVGYVDRWTNIADSWRQFLQVGMLKPPRLRQSQETLFQERLQKMSAQITVGAKILRKRLRMMIVMNGMKRSKDTPLPIHPWCECRLLQMPKERARPTERTMPRQRARPIETPGSVLWASSVSVSQMPA